MNKAFSQHVIKELTKCTEFGARQQINVTVWVHLVILQIDCVVVGARGGMSFASSCEKTLKKS